MNEHKPQLCLDERSLPEGVKKIDTFATCLRELFYIQNPSVDKRDQKTQLLAESFIENQKKIIKDLWVVYTAAHTAIRIPEEDIFYFLRTARNRNLILEEEQNKYRNFKVGIAGLSVGSAVLASLVQTGGPKNIRIADPDTIELTNLNRIRATLLDLGKNKAEVAASNTWELDPFAELDVWDEGIAAENIDAFLLEDGALDVFIDEMDSIKLKIAARKHCKEHGIPVIMATDNGDSVIVDIERFDLEPNRPLFHGQLSDEELNADPQNSQEFITLANKIIDPSLFTRRQKESVMEIGKSLSGVAQLSTAASLAGAAIAYVVRGLANEYDLPSGRYTLGCEDSIAQPNL